MEGIDSLRLEKQYVDWIAAPHTGPVFRTPKVDQLPLSGVTALLLCLYIAFRKHEWTTGAHIMSDVGRVLFIAAHYSVRRLAHRLESHSLLNDVFLLRRVHAYLWGYHTHKDPEDPHFVFTPLVVAVPGVALVTRVIFWYAWHPWSVLFGFLTAFVVTEALHYACHTETKLPGLRYLRDMHAVHHTQRGAVNVGIGVCLLADALNATLQSANVLATVVEETPQRNDHREENKNKSKNKETVSDEVSELDDLLSDLEDEEAKPPSALSDLDMEPKTIKVTPKKEQTCEKGTGREKETEAVHGPQRRAVDSLPHSKQKHQALRKIMQKRFTETEETDTVPDERVDTDVPAPKARRRRRRPVKPDVLISRA